jgi:hypothetical protein
MREPAEIIIGPNEVTTIESSLRKKSVEFYLHEYMKSKKEGMNLPFEKPVVLVRSPRDQLLSVEGNQIVLLSRLLGIEKLRAYLLRNAEHEVPYLHAKKIEGNHLYPQGKSICLNEEAVRGIQVEASWVDVFEDMFLEANASSKLVRNKIEDIRIVIDDVLSRNEEFLGIEINHNGIWYTGPSSETKMLIEKLLQGV